MKLLYCRSNPVGLAYNTHRHKVALRTVEPAPKKRSAATIPAPGKNIHWRDVHPTAAVVEHRGRGGTFWSADGKLVTWLGREAWEAQALLAKRFKQASNPRTVMIDADVYALAIALDPSRFRAEAIVAEEYRLERELEARLRQRAEVHSHGAVDAPKAAR
jgi:hypothetical protein